MAPSSTMAASLQSLGDEVILPDNLLPDDTTLFYDDDGNPVIERDLDDPDDELAADEREEDRYADLFLAHYNALHDTDYKHFKVSGGESYSRYLKEESDDSISTFIHCGFFAAPSGYEDCKSAVKHFCAELDPFTEKIFFCCIVDFKTTTCEFCDFYTMERHLNVTFGLEKRGWDREGAPRTRRAPIPHLSEYAHHLAEGVTLSDKAKLRVRFTLLALAYYNKKQHKDYKLVDVLPNCESYQDSVEVVAHCNFIARESACADASNKLFFAELVKGKGHHWVVFACRILRGKTTAGCHNCPNHRGKRVIHPTRGFHFGLKPGGVEPLTRTQLRLRLRRH